MCLRRNYNLFQCLALMRGHCAYDILSKCYSVNCIQIPVRGSNGFVSFTHEETHKHGDSERRHTLHLILVLCQSSSSPSPNGLDTTMVLCTGTCVQYEHNLWKITALSHWVLFTLYLFVTDATETSRANPLRTALGSGVIRSEKIVTTNHCNMLSSTIPLGAI